VPPPLPDRSGWVKVPQVGTCPRPLPMRGSFPIPIDLRMQADGRVSAGGCPVHARAHGIAGQAFA